MGCGSSTSSEPKAKRGQPGSAPTSAKGLCLLNKGPAQKSIFWMKGLKLKAYKLLLSQGFTIVGPNGEVLEHHDLKASWTTQQVCDALTAAAPHAALVQCLSDTSLVSTKDYQGTFVSHARKCNFAQLIDALLNRLGEETYVWIDIFQIDQSASTVPPTDEMSRWMREGLHKALTQFDRRVAVFNTWDEPEIITRSWCAWEFYGCVMNGKELEIALSKQEEQRFVKEALLGDVQSIFDRLSTMDIAVSEAHDITDTNFIAELIEQNVGFARLNDLVLGKLRDWYVTAAKAQLHPLDGKGSKDEGTLCKNIGVLLMQMQRPGEAAPFNDRAATIFEKLGSATQREFATALNNKALCDMSLAKIDSASKAAEKSLAVFKALDFTHPRVAVALNTVAAVCLEMSPPDYESALLHYQQALEIFESHKDEQNEATAISNVAEVLTSTGKVEEAIELLRQALKKLEGKEEHIWSQPVYINLALALKQKGDFDGAISTLTKVLALQKRVLGTKNGKVAATLTDLAKCYGAKGDIEHEKKCLVEALDAGVASFGHDSRNVAIYMSNLADWLYDHGDKAEAKSKAKEALAIFTKVVGPDHAYTKALKDAWHF